MEKNIKDIAAYAQEKGIKSFILLLMNGPALTSHFQEMKTGDAIKLLQSGLRNILEQEIENVDKTKNLPEGYMDEYKEIINFLLTDFTGAFKKANDLILKAQKDFGINKV